MGEPVATWEQLVSITRADLTTRYCATCRFVSQRTGMCHAGGRADMVGLLRLTWLAWAERTVDQRMIYEPETGWSAVPPWPEDPCPAWEAHGAG